MKNPTEEWKKAQLARNRARYARNPGEYNEVRKAWYVKNREQELERQKERRRKNPGAHKEWKRRNPEKMRAIRAREIARHPELILKAKLRCRITAAMKRLGHHKTCGTVDILGCSITDFREHIQKQFSPGMNWNNHGLWHIDHIIPLGSAKTPDEFFVLCHHTNLQPLWASDNMKKWMHQKPMEDT